MAETGSAARPLDEVMLAMDVVDTLRHNKRLVERELNSERRDEALITRLREIYSSQGIEVTDQVLAEGVRALKEERFRYTLPDGGPQVWLAKLYVSRAHWGKPLLAIVAIVAVLGIGYLVGSSYLQSRATSLLTEAPAQLANEVRAITALTREQRAVQTARDIQSRGEAAASGGDGDAVKAAMTELESLKARLDQEYVIQIVSRPNEMSGVYRIPEDNPSAKNYYLIVEAVAADGSVMAMDITSEEDGNTRSVEKWGVRVDERVFLGVASDKRDDGIIQDRVIGRKQRGMLEPEYASTISKGAITSW
jgi:hypothetical protein